MAAPIAFTIWRRRLGVALRIALAYAIILCTTIYGPVQITEHVITYPSYSYLMTSAIVSEATLGDTMRGTWHAIIGTFLAMGPSTLSLWLIGPENFNPVIAALVVAVGTFSIALPASITLMAKRIAFGQLVTIFAGAVCSEGSATGVVMQPLGVAASSGLGAVASILAMLLPFPRLSVCEVKKRCEEYAENVTDRINCLYVKVAEENYRVLDLTIEAKMLSESSAKLLHEIRKYQDGMLWEMPRMRLLIPGFKPPTELLQQAEVSLRGMEMAVASMTQKLNVGIKQELKDVFQVMTGEITEKLEQIKRLLPFSLRVRHHQKTDHDSSENKLLPLDICNSQRDLSLAFFLFCMKHLNMETSNLAQTEEKNRSKNAENHSFTRTVRSWLPACNSLVFAVKCSLTLGLSVLLGVLYDKENGYCAGLAVAFGFATSRQATFWGANARIQGTALGSVYGVIGYLICHRYSCLKLAFLLPLIVFTTFLRHSKVYGEAGSMSANVAALLVLGRAGYGSPTDFAIVRAAEVVIGVFCFVLVEVFLQPKRAASLSKQQLSQCFGTINQLMDNIMAICAFHNKLDPSGPAPSTQEEKAKLKAEINLLKGFVEVAEMEPDFWFTPFQVDSYTSLQKSITKIASLSSFMASAVELLSQEMRISEDSWKDYQNQISLGIGLFLNNISTSLEYLKDATSADDFQQDEKDQQRVDSTYPEMGKPQKNNKGPMIDDEEIENIISTFLQHTRDATDSNYAAENADVRNKMLLSFGCIGFCMGSLVTEVKEVEKLVIELILKQNEGEIIPWIHF